MEEAPENRDHATGAPADAVVVPQAHWLRAVYLLNALLCFAAGRLGGLAGTSEAGMVWSAVAIVWTAFYLWALWVPYLRVSGGGLIVCSMPFSRADASADSISEMSFGNDAVEVHQVNGRTATIRLRRVPAGQRPEVLELLRGIEARVAELERQEAAEFESTWGVDPATRG